MRAAAAGSTAPVRRAARPAVAGRLRIDVGAHPGVSLGQIRRCPASARENTASCRRPAADAGRAPRCPASPAPRRARIPRPNNSPRIANVDQVVPDAARACAHRASPCRYPCRGRPSAESTLMISSGKRSASRSASSDLPAPVGPISNTAVGASAPAQEQPVQIGEASAAPRSGVHGCIDRRGRCVPSRAAARSFPPGSAAAARARRRGRPSSPSRWLIDSSTRREWPASSRSASTSRTSDAGSRPASRPEPPATPFVRRQPRELEAQCGKLTGMSSAASRLRRRHPNHFRHQQPLLRIVPVQQPLHALVHARAHGPHACRPAPARRRSARGYRCRAAARSHSPAARCVAGRSAG